MKTIDFLIYFFLENSPTPPQYIFWYHNSRMINYDVERGVKVDIRAVEDTGKQGEEEEGVRRPEEWVRTRTVSRLELPAARKEDEGNYTCLPSNSEPATVHVFIQEGNIFPMLIDVSIISVLFSFFKVCLVFSFQV